VAVRAGKQGEERREEGGRWGCHLGEQVQLGLWAEPLDGTAHLPAVGGELAKTRTEQVVFRGSANAEMAGMRLPAESREHCFRQAACPCSGGRQTGTENCRSCWMAVGVGAVGTGAGPDAIKDAGRIQRTAEGTGPVRFAGSAVGLVAQTSLRGTDSEGVVARADTKEHWAVAVQEQQPIPWQGQPAVEATRKGIALVVVVVAGIGTEIASNWGAAKEAALGGRRGEVPQPRCLGWPPLAP